MEKALEKALKTSSHMLKYTIDAIAFQSRDDKK